MAERPEACAEWRDDLAAWLVAQVAPEREVALADHLATCPACRAEAESLLAVAAVTLAVDPVADVEPAQPGDDEPPPDLGDRILARVAVERRGRARLRAGVAALAASAAVVVAILVVRDGDDAGPLDGEPIEFARVPAGATVEAVVAEDEGDGSLVELVASGLEPDITYALWLSPPGGGWEDRIPAGTFRPDEDGQVDVRLRCALPAHDAGRVWATTPDGEVTLDTE